MGTLNLKINVHKVTKITKMKKGIIPEVLHITFTLQGGGFSCESNDKKILTSG